MAKIADIQSESVFARLNELARKRALLERCELCSREIGKVHQHLVEPAIRRLICACEACAILFDGRHDNKYKRVPRNIQFLPDFRMSHSQWESMMIPIEMAFFFRSSSLGRVIALYPSPAGATESSLPLDAWEYVVRENPLLESMESDVEALLVNRVGATEPKPAEYFLVPIDACYELVGLIRTHWRGFAGGPEMWSEIATFFAELKRRAKVRCEAAHA